MNNVYCIGVQASAKLLTRSTGYWRIGTSSVRAIATTSTRSVSTLRLNRARGSLDLELLITCEFQQHKLGHSRLSRQYSWSSDFLPSRRYISSVKMGGRKFFVGGNWKMNGTKSEIKAVVDKLNGANLNDQTDIVVSPPACYLEYTKSIVKPAIKIAGQNSYKAEKGAYTGDLSPQMLTDVGAEWVILGHSERRNVFGETDEVPMSVIKDGPFVRGGIHATIMDGLGVIACIGEKLEEREGGQTEAVVYRQMAAIAAKVQAWDKVVIAYEPVWAIGTGKTATPQQAQEVHAQLRKWMKEKVPGNVADTIRIIYGGSVTGGNCRELAKEADIDGFLVGGASLKPEFIEIINSRT